MGLEDPNFNPQNEPAAKYGTNFTFYVLQKYMLTQQSTKMEQTKLAHKKKIKRKY